VITVKKLTKQNILYNPPTKTPENVQLNDIV